jgi:hypothetical protein
METVVIIENENQFNHLCETYGFKSQQRLGYQRYRKSCERTNRGVYTGRVITDNRLGITVDEGSFSYCDISWYKDEMYNILTFGEWSKTIYIHKNIKKHSLI